MSEEQAGKIKVQLDAQLHLAAVHAELRLEVALRLLAAYRAKRKVDGLNGRTWNAGAHLDAEEKIVELEEKFAMILEALPRPNHVEMNPPAQEKG